MSKFQKGDIVRIIKKGSDWEHEGKMDKYLGHVVEVESADEFTFHILRYKEDCPSYSPNSIWCFSDNEAELVYRPCESESGKTYDDGMNDMYDAIKKVILSKAIMDGGLTADESNRLFGTTDAKILLTKFNPRQIVNTVKAHEEDKLHDVEVRVHDLAEEIGINRLYDIVKELRGE